MINEQTKKYYVLEFWMNGDECGEYDSKEEAIEKANELARYERLSKKEYNKRENDFGTVGYAVFERFNDDDNDDLEEIAFFKILNPKDVEDTKDRLRYNRYRHLDKKTFKLKQTTNQHESVLHDLRYYSEDIEISNIIDIFIENHFNSTESCKYSEDKLLSSDFIIKEFELLLNKFEIIEEDDEENE